MYGLRLSGGRRTATLRLHWKTEAPQELIVNTPGGAERWSFKGTVDNGMAESAQVHIGFVACVQRWY